MVRSPCFILTGSLSYRPKVSTCLLTTFSECIDWNLQIVHGHGRPFRLFFLAMRDFSLKCCFEYSMSTQAYRAMSDDQWSIHGACACLARMRGSHSGRLRPGSLINFTILKKFTHNFVKNRSFSLKICQDTCLYLFYHLGLQEGKMTFYTHKIRYFKRQNIYLCLRLISHHLLP